MKEEIIYLSITVFITQLIFIGCRTWNVRAISTGKKLHVYISGTIIHLSWLISIAIGSTSAIEIVKNGKWDYWPVILASLVGGLIGSHFGMKQKKKKK